MKHENLVTILVDSAEIINECHNQLSTGTACREPQCGLKKEHSGNFKRYRKWTHIRARMQDARPKTGRLYLQRCLSLSTDLFKKTLEEARTVKVTKKEKDE